MVDELERGRGCGRDGARSAKWWALAAFLATSPTSTSPADLASDDAPKAVGCRLARRGYRESPYATMVDDGMSSRPFKPAGDLDIRNGEWLAAMAGAVSFCYIDTAAAVYVQVHPASSDSCDDVRLVLSRPYAKVGYAGGPEARKGLNSVCVPRWWEPCEYGTQCHPDHRAPAAFSVEWFSGPDGVGERAARAHEALLKRDLYAALAPPTDAIRAAAAQLGAELAQLEHPWSRFAMPVDDVGDFVGDRSPERYLPARLRAALGATKANAERLHRSTETFGLGQFDPDQQDRARVFQLEPVAKLLRQAAELYNTALIDVAERHPKLYFTSAIPAALQSLTPAQRGWTPCRAPAFRHAAQRGSQAFTDGAIKGSSAVGRRATCEQGCRARAGKLRHRQ